MSKILLFAAIGWTIVFITIVCFVDFDSQMQPLLQISDYLMTFHVAGSLVAHGQLDKLYPPVSSIVFAGMPFDVIAHQILTRMPPASVAEFMYMPLAAAVFVPFSFLPLNLSIFAWQVISLCALFLSGQLMWLATHNERRAATDTLTRSLSALFIIPVCLTIWIGQVGLVFGMLPLALGYFFLNRKKYFFAGIAWSFAILKPQFLVPVGVLVFGLLLQKRPKALLGLLSGLAALSAIGVIAFSPALNLEWLNCLRISDIVYSDPRSGIATHIATSLPRTIILMLPSAVQHTAKPIIYAFAAIILCSALGSVLLLLKKVQNISNLNQSIFFRVSCLLGIFVTPLVMPHFFLYDYCLFALVLPVVFNAGWSADIDARLKRLTLLMICVVNTYSLIVMTAHKLAYPLVFMLLMLGLYIRLLWTVSKFSAAEIELAQI